MTHSLERCSGGAGTAEIMESALCVLRVPDDQKDTARGWIKRVAAMLTEHAVEQKAAPRLADIKTRLPEAVRRARKLITFLERDVPYVRSVAAGYDLMESHADLDRGKPAIPKVLSYDPQPLQAALAEFAAVIGPLAEAWPQDSGGEPDLFAMFSGSPKQAFAVRCWELFTWFRPGEAKSSDTGEYHLFAEYLYALATGRHPSDDSAGLERYTKRAAKKCNAFAASNPHFERVRRALPASATPFGIIEASSVGSRVFRAPTRLRDRLMKGSIGKK